jgi:hypothetical protein
MYPPMNMKKNIELKFIRGRGDLYVADWGYNMLKYDPALRTFKKVQSKWIRWIDHVSGLQTQ